MNTPARLAGYGLVLAAAFAAALGVGTAVGPVFATTPAAQAPAGTDHAMEGKSEMTHGPVSTPGMAGMGPAAGAQGLAVAADGYTLVPTTAVLHTGATTSFSFRILGPDGTPLTGYTLEHERELHFIVVRRDLTGYQHLHPTRASDGTWNVPLRLPGAGAYKAFVDFQPAGAAMPLTLAVDLLAPGDFQPTDLPAPAHAASMDGYTITLAGTLTAGRESDLTFRIERDGQPVSDLQPYLGAYGHLVALRVGDLAYAHVHPEGTPGDGHTAPGPAVAFHADLVTDGAYRLFLDFQTGGVVHTAAFTAIAGT